MAQIPGQVESIFLNSKNQISPNGIYAVNFQSLGLPHTVIVDDQMPLNSSGKLRYAGIANNVVRDDDGSLWVPILEKAYAKYQGNYEHLAGGWMSSAITNMNGGPSVNHRHNRENGIS